jgi:hypothetical protein
MAMAAAPFPLAFPTTDCPDCALLQQFLDRSPALEQEILGVGVKEEDDASAAHHHHHTQAFWNHSRQQAFCSVNVTEVLLQDPDNAWKDFYQSLP